MTLHTSAACLALLALLLTSEQPSPPLLISEVDYDPPGRDETGEWVELVYLGDEPMSLSRYKIGDEEQLGHGEGMFRFPEGSVAAPGQVIVIARNAPAFRARFGANPDFEFYTGDPAVPDMVPYAVWASGELFLANDGDEVVVVGPDNVIVDAINWGNSSYFFTPPIPAANAGQTLARTPAYCDEDRASDWVLLDTPSPGEVTISGECRTSLPPTDVSEVTGPIGAIQGEGASSPYLNEAVTLRGIVTGIQEDRNSRGAIFYTLFVQDDPADADGDPATSDAIPVFTATARPSFEPGDAIQVTGSINEFYGLTEVNFRDLELVPLDGYAHPLPPSVPLADIRPGSLEQVEGMRVTLPRVRVAGATHSGCGFAVALLDTPLPLLREDPLIVPGPVLPVVNHSNVDCSSFPEVKRGDIVAGLTGPLTYQFDQFQLVLQDAGAVEVSPAPLPEPRALSPAPPRQFTAVSFNLHDYFMSDPGLAARKRKIAQMLATYLDCPTIIAVEEVESRDSLYELGAALATLCGHTYAVAHRDGPDARGLDVALLADNQRVHVTAVESHQVCTLLDTGIVDATARCPTGESPLHSRPPLQIDATIDGTSYSFFVNHLKSKREGEVETGSWRLAQATHLAALVSRQLEGDRDAALLVMGDFNDIPRSPALQTLFNQATLIDPMQQLPEDTRYTYVFGGYAELLDNILLSPGAAAELADVGVLHMNTDFPHAWTTDLATPFRASDHDVPWVRLRLPAAPTPLSTMQPDTIPPSPTPFATATPPPAPLRTPPRASRLQSRIPSFAVLALAGGAALSLLLARRRRP